MYLEDEESSNYQQYFVIDFELPEESNEERKMMNDLKNKIEGKFDYNQDIPLKIREDVDSMLHETLEQKEKRIKLSIFSRKKHGRRNRNHSK